MDGDGAASGRDEGATDGFDAGRPASCRSRSPSRVSFGSGNGGGSMRPFPHLEVDVPSNDSLNGDGATLVRGRRPLRCSPASPARRRPGGRPAAPVPPSPSHIIGAAPLTVRDSPLRCGTAAAAPQARRHGRAGAGARWRREGYLTDAAAGRHARPGRRRRGYWSMYIHSVRL